MNSNSFPIIPFSEREREKEWFWEMGFSEDKSENLK